MLHLHVALNLLKNISNCVMWTRNVHSMHQQVLHQRGQVRVVWLRLKRKGQDWQAP